MNALAEVDQKFGDNLLRRTVAFFDGVCQKEKHNVQVSTRRRASVEDKPETMSSASRN
jgi:hypothetical protein